MLDDILKLGERLRAQAFFTERCVEQALCFLAGANSIFHGEKLLTTKNATVRHDEALFAKLGMRAES